MHDILSVLERRHDTIDVLIYPTEVQGDTAAPRIAAGIRALDTKVDLVIVARGGGSIEDLWPFNEEVVARAIAECETAVVSAVGHETDFTICDFVADVRAPTPSAAAEIVSKSKQEIAERLDAAERRMTSAIRFRLSQLRQFLAARVGGRGFAVAEGRFRQMSQQVDDYAFRMERVARSGELVDARRRRLEDASNAMGRVVAEKLRDARLQLTEMTGLSHRTMERIVSQARQRFAALGETLDALSPLGVLERGFAVCRKPDGTVLRSADQTSPARILKYCCTRDD